MAKVTPWFRWPVRPVRQGWYDFRGFMVEDMRYYWDGKQWGEWDRGGHWVHLADCATDEWRGLTKPYAGDTSR
jgi:hypothetical protein